MGKEQKRKHLKAYTAKLRCKHPNKQTNKQTNKQNNTLNKRRRGQTDEISIRIDG